MTPFERKQLEFMAAACCFAEFRGEYGTKKTPLAYWRGVSNPQAREFYRNQARSIIALVRTMPTVKP